MKKAQCFLLSVMFLSAGLLFTGCPVPGAGTGTQVGGPTYTVTYDGNGASGSVPVDSLAHQPGATVTVISSSGTLTMTGYALAGWTTKVDGTGTSYARYSATFTMGTADMTLYAVWVPDNLKFDYSSGTSISITGYTSKPTGSLTIPAGVTRLKSAVFFDCTSLTEVSIPASVTIIDKNPFRRCTSLTGISVDIHNPNFKSISGALYDKTGTTLVAVPGGITGSYTISFGVTGIADMAFADCTGLTGVTIPAGVTTIDPVAFDGCSSLTNFDVDARNPAYDTESGALCDKAGTTLLMVPKGVTGSYDIPSSITVIGDYALYGCTGLTDITIPSGVAGIGIHAFEFCTGLTGIAIPSSVTSIGAYAFNDCYVLTSVNIEPGVASIGAYAFSSCPLNSVTIPDGVTSIGDGAFSGCKLTSVTLPASVSSFGKGCFGACPNLTSISVDAANLNYKSISGVLFDKSGDTLLRVPGGMTGSYDIPAGVTNIGDDAIMGCTQLTEITIPAGVTSIGASAFSYCTSLSTVTIPSSVTSIGNYAFSCCYGLTSVTVLAATPPSLASGSKAFDGCGTGLQINVPVGTVGDYRASTGWSDCQAMIVSP